MITFIILVIAFVIGFYGLHRNYKSGKTLPGGFFVGITAPHYTSFIEKIFRGK